MNWRIKGIVQKSLAILPGGIALVHEDTALIADAPSSAFAAAKRQTPTDCMILAPQTKKLSALQWQQLKMELPAVTLFDFQVAAFGI